MAGGAQLRVFPKAVLDACYAATQEQYAEWAAKHPEFKTMLASYMNYMQEEIAWFRVAEGSYDNYMSQAMQKVARK